MEKTSGNRWLIVVGTVIAQLGLGTIYAWSMFNQPLVDKFGFQLSQVALTFSVTSLALALSTLAAGRRQDKLGIRRLTTAAGVLLGIGLILTSMDHSLKMLYLTAGVLVGAADGVAYITTLSNCIKWFPDKKGLISGISVGAYGSGSLIFKYVDGSLINGVGVSSAFLFWGVIAMVLVIAGAQLLKDAPLVPAQNAVLSDGADCSVKEMLQSWKAYALFIVFFTACMSGLYLIGIVKDIGVQLVGMSAAAAANAVAMVAIFNTAGRLILGALSDRLGRLRVIILTMSVTAVSVLVLSFVSLNTALFYLCVCAIAFCFGGNITVFPTIVGDFFGSRNQTKNYGVIYQGFGFGAITASLISSLTGSFMDTFVIVGILCIISLFLVIGLELLRTGRKSSRRSQVRVNGDRSRTIVQM